MRNKKWISNLLSITLACSIFLFPHYSQTAASSQSNLNRSLITAKQQQLLRLTEKNKHLNFKIYQSQKKNTSVQSKDNIVSATYSHTMKSTEAVHSFIFEVESSGMLQIDSNTDQVDYTVSSLDQDDFLKNGDPINPGLYQLTVYNKTNELVNYQINVSGFSFVNAPDTSLPKLNVTNPITSYTRLAKGTGSIQVTGSLEESVGLFYGINGSNPVQVELTNNTFNKTISNLKSGYQDITLFAYNNTGNVIIADYMLMVPGVKRLAGADRYETAVKISEELPVTSDTVIVATGTAYPDALSGAPIASWEGAPILLAKSTGLPNSVKSEILRRGATNAIILGGTGVLPISIDTELKNLGIKKITRLGGTTRYETSAKIATYLLNSQDYYWGDHNKKAFLTAGFTFADALSASSPAGYYSSPILLSDTMNSVPTSTKQVIVNEKLSDFHIVGGAVWSGLIKELADTVGDSFTYQQYYGDNRYQTALAVAKAFSDPALEFPLAQNVHHVAYGANFPDAIAQGPLAAWMGAPLLLTQSSSLDSKVYSYLQQIPADAYYISGGTGVIFPSVETQLNSTID